MIYLIPGDDNLAAPHTLGTTGVSPALDAGLPVLGDYDGTAGADWEYRSFRLSDPITARPAGFILPELRATP